MSIRDNIINKAKEYLGYKEGANNDTQFGDWYGLPNNPWCAMFVSYVLDSVGVSQEIAPKFASCSAGFNKFTQMGVATKEKITPQKGDIIFFVWQVGNTADHVGLVEKVENGKVYTIEGNRSDKVEEYSYELNDSRIYGYATPKYVENENVVEETKPSTPETNENKKPDIYNDGLVNCIYDIQEWLRNKYGYNLSLDNLYGPETKKYLTMALQHELNVQFNAGLAEDGIWGTKTYNACINVRQGASGNITMLIQMALFVKGYSLGMDKQFGEETARVLRQFQADNGLTVDAVCGKNSFRKLFE